MEATLAEEPEEDASTEEPTRGDTLVMAKEEQRGGGQLARREEVVEWPAAPVEPTEVVDLEARGKGPTRAKLANAPAEPEVGGDVPRTRDEEGSTGGEGEGEMTPSSSSRSESSMARPRQPPRFSAMESERMEERLLERVRLLGFRDQLRWEPISRVFDATYVLVLQLADEVLTLRDTMVESNSTVVGLQKRSAQYRGKYEEVARELSKAEACEKELADKLGAADEAYGNWEAWFQEAERRAAAEFSWVHVTDAKLDEAMARLRPAELKAEELAQ